MNIVGFDFGTTNTVISRIEEGVPRNYFDSETGQPIPSVVCYDGVKKNRWSGSQKTSQYRGPRCSWKYCSITQV